MWTLFITAYLNRRKYAAVSNNNATKRYNNQIVNLRFLRGSIGEILWEKCDKISKNTNISLITDTISNDIDTSKKPICKVPIRYRYIDIGDISNIIYLQITVKRAQTSTKASIFYKLNQQWLQDIRKRISGLIRMSAGSIPKCCGFMRALLSCRCHSFRRVSW